MKTGQRLIGFCEEVYGIIIQFVFYGVVNHPCIVKAVWNTRDNNILRKGSFILEWKWKRKRK